MNQDIEPRPVLDSAAQQSHKNLALIGYALQALGLVTGVAAVAGLILNYLKRSEVQGSYIASHFTWQIKTFWFGLLGVVIGALLAIIGIGVIIMFATGIWYIYRIVKGWLALNEGKELPNTLI